MADKMVENGAKLTAFQKVNDWYSKHNFGTRLALFSFLGMYILAVGTSVDYTVFSSIDTNVTHTLATTAKAASGTDIELVSYPALKDGASTEVASATSITKLKN